jgi:23S rRNA (cytidine1920-2'-O)/16S rRNA (cytidine1409-2'-O)-methyltransferase
VYQFSADELVVAVVVSTASTTPARAVVRTADRQASSSCRQSPVGKAVCFPSTKWDATSVTKAATRHFPMPKKFRLDQVLVTRGSFPSREQAQRAIMAGEIKIGTRVASKASEMVEPDAEITAATAAKYVGRGGLKLEGALDHFKIDPADKLALDIGASTGGFTDCLLQRGAAKVYAVDVGHDQLAWKIRSNPRVVVLEKRNARSLSRDQIPEPIDICVIDVSFISLTLILPNAFDLITPDGVILALIKPQFELQRDQVGRGGVVRDTSLHQAAQHKIVEFVTETLRQLVVGVTSSPVAGAEGNQEFFACLQKRLG